MKKIFAVILSLLLSVMLFAGCGSKEEAFISSDKSSSGGSAQINTNVNLKNISISEANGQTDISLFFLSGSTLSGKDETKISALPQYEVSFLPSPARMIVRINNVDYYDYSSENQNISSSIVSGEFNVIPSGAEYIDVYFPLSSNVSYKVSEETDTLKISLKSAGSVKDAYYAVTNAFISYQEGSFPKELNFSPMLCSDKESIVLISAPCSSEAEANSIKENAQSSIPAGSVIKVIHLGGNALPDVVSDIDVNSITSSPAALVNGKPKTLEAVIKNGKFLDADKNGNMLFSRSYVMNEIADDDYAPPLYEKLWVSDVNGNIEQLELQDFDQIVSAKYSPSGKYIAILELSSENSVLYSYNIQTKQLLNLSEEGLGNITDTFTFDETRDVIFSVSGTSGQKQVMKVDLEGDELISAIEERETNSTKIAVKQGRLFITDFDEEGNINVYEITLDGRRKITSGVDFAINSSLTQMAVITFEAGEGGGGITGLKIIDLSNGSELLISDNLQIQQIGYVGDKFYYTTAVESIEGNYAYDLYAYSSSSSLEAKLITGDFITANDNIYLLYYVSGPDNASDFYITFKY